MLLISATLSILALQVNNVDAATVDDGNNTDKTTNIQSHDQLVKQENSGNQESQEVNATAATLDSNTIPEKSENDIQQNRSYQKKTPSSTSPAISDAPNQVGQSAKSSNVSKQNDNEKIFQSANSSEDKNNNFDQMLQSWKDVTVGEKYYDAANSDMRQISSQQDSDVTKLWNSMNKENQKESIWSGTDELTTSANITTDYRNLEAMAIATANPGSKYYNNPEMTQDIVDGFVWLSANKYNSNIKAYGNWWDWEIGSPLFINNIVTIMYPHLTKEQVKDAMNAITYFVPDPDYFRGSVNPKVRAEATGANQVDICKVKIIQALLENDEPGLKKAVQALEKVFPIVNTGEGFYKDGSFIQHENVGYNGSYGNVLIDGVSQLLPVLQNTPYSLSDNSINSVNFWIEKGFAPFIYKGNLMDMVRGRAISRGTFQSDVAGADLIRSIVRVVETYPKDEKAKYQSLIKYWLSFGNNYKNYISQITSYRDIALITDIMDNPSIQAKDFQATNLYNFAKMDKVLLKNADNDFAIGINMSSSRIKRYESLNNENTHGWYTGDGMLFIYNNDLDQFNDDYWATVDPYRLPGTTETDKVQKDGSGAKASSKTFVGGSYFGNIGAIGNVGSIAMDFINNDQDLTAHKSWFLMHNGVVALGSGINNDSNSKALTVIDNRKLSKNSDYNIYVNGKLYAPKIDETKEFSDVTSIYLQSNKPSESIGYKFLTPQKINLGLIERTGSWSEINKAQSKDEFARNYLEIYKIHEKKANDTYNYVIYPNIAMDKFENETNPRIIKNDDSVQAISYGNTVGINVFKPTETKVMGMDFKEPISVTRINNGNQILLGVSDPSQNSEADTTFRIKDDGYKIINKDVNLKANLVDGYWNVSLLKNGHDGNTKLLSLSKK